MNAPVPIVKTAAQRNELLIDIVLSSIPNTTEAAKYQNVSFVQFSAENQGEYKTAADAMKEPAWKALREAESKAFDKLNAIAKMEGELKTIKDEKLKTAKEAELKAAKQELMSAPPAEAKAIRESPITRVRIDLDGKQARYFKRVHATDGKSERGLKAVVWLEIDATGKELADKKAKVNPIFAFSGTTGQGDFLAFNDGYLGGKMNRQVVEAPDFTKEGINKIGAERIGVAHVAGHSAGVQLAFMAQQSLRIAGIQTDSMNALEPYGLTIAVDTIRRELENPGSTLANLVNQAFPGNSLMATGAEAVSNPNLFDIRSLRMAHFDKEKGEVVTSSMASTAKLGKKEHTNEAEGKPFHFFRRQAMNSAESKAPPATGNLKLVAGLRKLVEPKKDGDGNDYPHMAVNMAYAIHEQNVANRLLFDALDQGVESIAKGRDMLINAASSIVSSVGTPSGIPQGLPANPGTHRK